MLFSAIGAGGGGKLNTRRGMLSFRLKAAPDADLVLELAARGRDVSSLIAEIRAGRAAGHDFAPSGNVVLLTDVKDKGRHKKATK